MHDLFYNHEQIFQQNFNQSKSSLFSKDFKVLYKHYFYLAPWVKASVSNGNLFVGESVEIIGDVSDNYSKTITFSHNVLSVSDKVFAHLTSGIFSATSYGKMLFGERLTFISKDLGFSVFISNLTLADSMTVIMQLENENQEGDALASISINVKGK